MGNSLDRGVRIRSRKIHGPRSGLSWEDGFGQYQIGSDNLHVCEVKLSIHKGEIITIQINKFMIEIITGGERLRPPPALHLRSYSQGLNWKSNTSTDRRYDRIGPGGAIR